MDNQCIMQYFESYLPSDGLLWRKVEAQAKTLQSDGVDIVWLPPAYKGVWGARDVGYGVYDAYDLGEFDQKNSVGTKYGTREEYLQCIATLQQQGITVLGDIVMDHRIGADETEEVRACKVNEDNRLEVLSDNYPISCWTRFTFPGRQGKYSDFMWDCSCFTGIDYDLSRNEGGLFRFEGKEWSPNVSSEKGNFDYLMGANVDVRCPKVQQELIDWGKWYLETTGLNGFRLDALKHIDYQFCTRWLDAMAEANCGPLFSVGEYWSGDVNDLLAYLANTGYRVSLFDAPLHFNFHNASQNSGGYNMRTLLDGTLVSRDWMHTVTFVDNHDSQPGQALESWVQDWFKPLAYATILLRKDGLPCVFYADYYGLEHDGRPGVPALRQMLAARKKYAYGDQRDYFDHDNVVGWTRTGDDEHPGSGCAVLLSDGPGGEKQMAVGEKFRGVTFRDVTMRDTEPVVIDDGGHGVFRTPGGGVTVWLPQPAYEDVVLGGQGVV